MQFQEENVQVQQYLQTIQKRWWDESYARTMEGRKLFKNEGGTEAMQKRWRDGSHTKTMEGRNNQCSEY